MAVAIYLHQRLKVSSAKKSTKKLQLPWISDHIRRLMKQRDHALKTCLKSKNNTDMLTFKSLGNLVVKEMCKSRSEYYINVLSEAKGNEKAIWKQLNCLINPNASSDFKYEINLTGETISDPNKVALVFNDYFITFVKELASQFPEKMSEPDIVTAMKDNLFEIMKGNTLFGML